MIEQPGPPPGAVNEDDLYRGDHHLAPEPPSMPNYGLGTLPMRPRTYDYHDTAVYGNLDAGYSNFDRGGRVDAAGMGAASHGDFGYHYQYHAGVASVPDMPLPPLTALPNWLALASPGRYSR